MLVCCWNVTIAILDMLVKSLSVIYLVQFVFNGNQEFAIAMVNFITASCYLFVPKITSLMIGQTLVSSAGAIPTAITRTVAAIATKGASLAKSGAASKAAAASPAGKPVTDSRAKNRESAAGNTTGARYAGNSANSNTARYQGGSFNSNPRTSNSINSSLKTSKSISSYLSERRGRKKSADEWRDDWHKRGGW